MPDMELRPVQDKKRSRITVDIYDDGEQTYEVAPGKSIILLDDSGISNDPRRNPPSRRHPGIRPRWAIVLETTPYAQKLGVEKGAKVLCDTMKWQRGIYVNDGTGRRVWFISADDLLAIDSDGPNANEKSKIESRYA